MSTSRRLLLMSGCAGLLAACAPMPASKEPPPPPRPSPPPPPPPPPAEPEPPPASVQPVTPQQAAKLTAGAIALLEAGKEEQAKEELQRALAGDPTNKLALSLMRQITVDPVATLGRESFSYTVKASDTLSVIAGRFMGDIYQFYILARYNGISVPRQLAGGQVLRIPGRQPAEAAPHPSPSPAPAAAPPTAPPKPAVKEATAGELAMKEGDKAERAGNLARAYAQYLEAARLDEPGASAKVDQTLKKLVAQLSRNARTAFAKQDLDGAIKAWDQVLVIDPRNDTAMLERQRALNLKEKLNAK